MPDDSIESFSMDDALTVCRDVLQRDVNSGATLEGLREPLRLLSTCARRDNLPPERLLVVIKKLLHDVTAYEALPPQERDALRGRLIQMVIAAYYGNEMR